MSTVCPKIGTATIKVRGQNGSSNMVPKFDENYKLSNNIRDKISEIALHQTKAANF